MRLRYHEQQRQRQYHFIISFPLSFLLLFFMNLTLVLLVLSTFVAYLIYDMFKKSRQEQQIAQVQESGIRSPEKSRLKLSYSAECSILRSLHEQKMGSLRHKSVSIHLKQENLPEVTPENITKLRVIIKRLKQSHKIYLLISKNNEIRNSILRMLREEGLSEICFQSVEGAVAVLRQLNCGVHLESELALYKTLIQYLPCVWLANQGGNQQKLVNQYSKEWEMVAGLGQLLGSPTLKQQ